MFFFVSIRHRASNEMNVVSANLFLPNVKSYAHDCSFENVSSLIVNLVETVGNVNHHILRKTTFYKYKKEKENRKRKADIKQNLNIAANIKKSI